MTVRPISIGSVALAGLLLCAGAIPSAASPTKPPARTPAGDAKLLELLFPGDRDTAARNRTAPPGLRAIDPSGWAVITAVHEARVIGTLIPSTLVEYQTFDDPGDESATRLGLAVIHRGAVRWRSPLAEIRGRDSTGRPNASTLSLHGKRPLAILWSFDYSRTSSTVRESVRLFHVYQWTGSAMAEFLNESAAIRHGTDATETGLKVRSSDRSGWRVIELATMEPGPSGRLQARTRFFTHQAGSYAESGTMEAATSRALRLLRPVPRFDGAGWPRVSGLPSLAALSSPEFVVQGRTGWKGAKSFSARVLGGTWKDGLLLLFQVTDDTPVLFSTAPKYGGGDTTQRDLRRTDRVELVFRERDGAQAVRLAMSPGNLSNVTPFASMWEPGFEAVAPGVTVRARRTAKGYELLALLGPEVLARRVRLADGLVCFSVIDIRDRGMPGLDCTIATAEKYRADDPMTMNPVTR